MNQKTLSQILTAIAISAILAAGNFFVSTRVSEAVTEQKFLQVADRFNDIISRLGRIEGKLDERK